MSEHVGGAEWDDPQMRPRAGNALGHLGDRAVAPRCHDQPRSSGSRVPCQFGRVPRPVRLGEFDPHAVG